MEVMNLKDFRKQIKRDSSIRKVRENLIAKVITIIENTDGYFETQSDFEDVIIQKIKDLI